MGKQVGSVTARNTPLVISFFVHISDAELALADLMAEGLSEQDFTLVKFGANMDGRSTMLSKTLLSRSVPRAMTKVISRRGHPSVNHRSEAA